MKKPEYLEGERALINLKNGMRALFQASKQKSDKRQPNKVANSRKKNERNNGKA